MATLMQMPVALVDGVTSFLQWKDVIAFGSTSKAAAEAAGTRLDAYVTEITMEPHVLGEGFRLVHALSQTIVLALAANSDAEDMHESALEEINFWNDFGRSGRGGYALRPRQLQLNPRSNLLKDHRLLLGRPLYGRMAWEAASLILGGPPFHSEWWARPKILEAAALALKDAHCALCALHLDQDQAENVIYERGAPQNARQLCSVCNSRQTRHLTRQVKNDMVRVQRNSRRAWKWCTHENPECYNYHHSSQDRCECECHE